ncbi:homoserine dehydrogenase [Streptococcus iniae]|uniref:Homoserine dehydrogenase n=1 Tax=Streptococcus iniae TaxID=1346 RepID=A0A3L8NM63_STRIN|nr:homoserine dehydrogenase [Streptococcus iniae]AHY15863.1 homoserine dehydrogenase [Streptococcus iniae]AHY17731.1 homoserine dehydrogenase [Streptococcus iniae]AJG26023.1 homoserine dehydrogenase [Streptococcus iniae]ATX39819.1 Homoserine dehydrogenase [Streptococcus iniae]EKB52804.1 homoserine dehydrogenase [Streptococcus iniae 9117]
MPIKIALLGFGTVASGLPFLLTENYSKISDAAGDDIVISKILVRNENEKNRLMGLGYTYEFVTSIDDILEDPEITIVVELMGRIEPAKTFICQALRAGKHVVTANKDLIALHGKEMRSLAQKEGLAFYYEAAVAGGIPILRTLANSYASDKITKLIGVLNGTSNYMMTQMVDKGWTYEQALAKAQELGYAESDPTNDVEGIDAAYKVAILSQFSFGMDLDFEQVSHKGISSISAKDVTLAQELGYVIKLLGFIEETASGISAGVSPTFIPEKHPLASVNGVMNAVYIESIGIGQSMLYGPGAGQKPTATSVMADIIRIARRLKEETIGKAFNEFKSETVLAKAADIVSSYYFSLETPDKPGQLLRIADIFNRYNVSFQQVLQEKAQGEKARLVIITHDMNQLQVNAVLKDIQQVKDFSLINQFRVLGD